MTTNPDRPDRIDDDLETIKDILLTVARCQEGLSAAQDRTQNQLDRLGFRVDWVAEQMGELTIQMGG